MSPVALGLALGGCIGTTPEEARREAQGSARDGDEEHRPGQPCLVCHDEDYNPGGRVFVLAGTVYHFATDPDDRGLSGAEVIVIDDDDRELTAITNRAGNFMFELDPGLDAPELLDRGRTKIPFQPTFPLSVTVRYAGEEKDMESLIWRDGSCAGCHLSSDTGTDHVEKVWLEEQPG